MSGYLTRLAASVHGAPSPIRPVVAPLFAAPPDTAELSIAEEEEQITPVRRHTRAQAGEALAASREPEVPQPATNSGIISAAEPHAANPAPAAPAHPPLGSASTTPDEAASLPEPVSQFPAPLLQDADEEIPVAGSYTPLLIVNTIQNVAPSSPVQNTAPFSPTLVKQQPTSSSHPLRSAGPTREPDEIQIHIGRIEVTAVAPSPPIRPAVTPARKSPSLDEYLKRGRRR